MQSRISPLTTNSHLNEAVKASYFTQDDQSIQSLPEIKQKDSYQRAVTKLF